jgi:hypothetical protein
MLLLTTSLFGVKVLPDAAGDEWKSSQSEIFQLNNDGAYEAAMTSTAIIEACKSSPTSFIDFPAIVYGAHIIKLDGKVVHRFGDPTFKSAHSIFGTFSIACSDLKEGRELEWSAYSFTKYFARITDWPHLVKAKPSHNFFYETLSMICGGGLLIIFIMCVLVFLGKISRDLSVSLAFAALCFSIYLFCSTPYLLMLPFEMLTIQKLMNASFWLGSGFLFYAFERTGVIGRKNLIFFFVCLSLGLFFIAAGKTGDTVQFGAQLLIIPYLLTMAIGFLSLVGPSIHEGLNRASILKFMSVGFFVWTAVNSIFVIAGMVNGPMFGSVAILVGVVFFALYLVEGIKAVYEERDVLSLQTEVFEKSAEIQNMLESIPVGILSIESREGKLVIGEDFSKFLVESLSIRSVKELSFDALLDRIGLTADNREMITNALHSCLHEEEISWDLNSSHFPTTSTALSSSTEEGEHYYRMTWSPLLVEGRIDKILVTILDETLLQAAKNQLSRAKGNFRSLAN